MKTQLLENMLDMDVVCNPAVTARFRCVSKKFHRVFAYFNENKFCQNLNLQVLSGDIRAL